MKKMIVKVLAGSVVVAGFWGEVAMSADGVSKKVFSKSGAPQAAAEDLTPDEWELVEGNDPKYKSAKEREAIWHGKLVAEKYETSNAPLYRYWLQANVLKIGLGNFNIYQSYQNKNVELKGRIETQNDKHSMQVGWIRLHKTVVVPRELAKRKRKTFSIKTPTVHATVTSDKEFKELAANPGQLWNFRHAGERNGLDFFVVDVGINSFPGVAQKYERYYCIQASTLPSKSFPLTGDSKLWTGVLK